MKKLISILILLNIFFIGCLNEINPEFGELILNPNWPQNIDQQILQRVNQVNVNIEPGDIHHFFTNLDSPMSIDCELGIYNITLDAIDDSSTVIFSADTSKILIEPFKTTNIFLSMIPAFPYLPPKFSVGKNNISNHGKFDISWYHSKYATDYQLIESSDSLFNEYNEIYTGSDTSYSITKTKQSIYFYKLQANNDIGTSPISDWVSFEYKTPQLSFIIDSLSTGKIGVFYEQQLSAEGGVPPYYCILSNGSLPDGIILKGSAGIISGIPTESGDYSVQFEIMDSGDPYQTVTKDFILTINPDDLAITTTSLPNGKVGDAYSQTLSASGGTTPYTWSIAGGSLPTGLSLNSSTGEISGTPTISGDATFTIQVSDNSEQTDSKEFTITINPADLAITTTSLPNGKVSDAYNQTLAASGGTTPYTWSIANGSLPSGISLNSSTGEISGTPTISGDATFTIQVSDNSEQTDTKEFTITIDPSDLAITTTSLPNGKVGDAYSQTLSASGGTTPYTWSITSGSLPAGLSLNSSAGEISGTPTISGDATFTIQVFDNGEQTDAKELTITIDPSDLAITTTTLANGKVGDAYSQTLAASGGTSPYSWSLMSGSLPAGISLNSSTGEIFGTPTISEDVTFTIQATDNSEQTDTKEFTIKINPADLTITTISFPNGKVGDAYSQTLAASGGITPYTWSIASGSLPTGLSLNSSTGEISGIPTTSGDATFTIQVSDNSEQTNSKEFFISINPEDLEITTISLPNGKVGDAYSQTLSASGGTTPYTWSIYSGSLPAGLSLNSSTGEISGTPTTSGDATFTVQVSDNGDQTDSKEFTITIDPPDLEITTISLANGKVGDAYSQTLSASGGTTPYSWSIANGNLPVGLSLNSSTGEISGSPTTSGDATFTIQVSDNSEQTDTKELTITIVPSDLTISSTLLIKGKVGRSYSHILSASGGTEPFTWSVISGSLPNGLTLNSVTGEISGTPTTSGDVSFTVQVTDKSDQTDSKELTITIDPADLNITTESLTDGKVREEYSQTLSASGGHPPYSWSIASGNLPNGMTLDTETGEISGTPTTSGNTTFNVQVEDARNETDTKEFTLTIAIADLAITTSSLADGKVGTSYSQTLSASGGTTPYTWSITSGTLPAGLSLNSSTGEISGTPTISGDATFTLQVTDNNANTDSKQFTITIQPADLTITTSSLPDGTVGEAYSKTLSASGGTTPFTWSITSGTLPDGLSLNSSTGKISGTPTAIAENSITIKVSDSVGEWDTKDFIIAIALGSVEISTSSLPNATAGTNYSQQLQASGGAAPYTWTEVSRSLTFPENISLASDGTLSGNPGNRPVSGTITVKVTDGIAQTDTKTLTLTVNAGELELLQAYLPDGNLITEYNGYIVYRYGTAPLQTPWTITGDFPEGLTITYDAQNYQMNISGFAVFSGTYNFNVTIYDSSSPTKTRTDSFTITLTQL